MIALLPLEQVNSEQVNSNCCHKLNKLLSGQKERSVNPFNKQWHIIPRKHPDVHHPAIPHEAKSHRTMAMTRNWPNSSYVFH